ncbi:MAG: DegV family protein [Ilumatobacteraceae bacterium]
MTIGICTDSGAQLPADLAARLGIQVVPLTVRVVDQEFLEGHDVDADQLYDLLSADDGDVDIVPPSPGQCAAAYEDLVDAGCTSIVAVHTSNGGCNTLSAARLASRAVPVPVRIVDTASSSFGVGCAAWAAADVARDGGGVDDVATAAETIGDRVEHVFTSGLEDRAYRVELGFFPDPTELATATTCRETATLMAAYALRTPGPLRVGVGAAGAEAVPLADQLASNLVAAGRELELVRYRIGAGVARRLRPGTVGCFVVR